MFQKCVSLLLSLLLLLPGAGCTQPEAGHTAAPAMTETPAPTPTPAPSPTPPPSPTVATLAVCGDVMSHMPITNDAWDETKGDYDYLPIMEGAVPLVQGADFAVANLETTLAGGPNYSGYPAFNSPDGLARSLREAGFDLLLTSNNHCLDKGFSGLSRTLDVLDGEGLLHVGTSRTAEEEAGNVQVADVGGISVAFLGYTYGTNGIPVPGKSPFAVNLFNTDYLTTCATADTQRLLEDLEAAKALNTDLIAVMIHWGIEYRTQSTAYQREVADLLFQNGADLVLGGHSHVLEPMELRTITDADGTKRQVFLSYSLGNFISSQNQPLTDLTAVISLELTKDNVTGKTEVTGYTYSPMLMLRRVAGSERVFELLDIHGTIEAGGQSRELTDKLTQALEDCHEILGPEHDAGGGEA